MNLIAATLTILYDSLENTEISWFTRIFRLTRRERLKSALYIRLIMRKTFFIKKLEIFDFFSFRKCRIVPKNVKGGTLWALLTYILLQNIKILERGTLLRHFRKKVAQFRKKIERGDPLVTVTVL